MKPTVSLSVRALIFSLITVSAAASADAGKQYVFQSNRKTGRIDQVKILLEIGGETQYVEKDKNKSEKMGVVCSLEYIEKTIGAPENNDTLRSVRHYQKAEAAVVVGEDHFQPKLSPDHLLIGVEAGQKKPLLYSPGGKLSRTELDAIDIQVNSLLLDRLLPNGPTAVGQSWSVDKDALAALFALDEVDESTVEAKLTEVTKIVARFEWHGKLTGRAEGTETAIELKGRYRFDLRSKRVDWLGMLIKEQRKASEIADGVDIVSRLQITVAPAKEPEELAGARLKQIDLRPVDESTRLVYEFPGGGCRCEYDRRWYGDAASGILRLVDDGRYAGQCNLALLPKRDPSRLVSLEEFQEDVHRALGDNFGAFVAARQEINTNGYRVLRVEVDGAVTGKAAKIPIRWVYYHLADRQGHQAALTFTIERENLDRFAGADKPIVASLEFIEHTASRK